MEKGRLEAFSDGVIAIIITIMVLELKTPHGASLSDLTGMWHKFLSYVLSFLYAGIYWNNHHHLFKAVDRVTGGILWANMHLLFWLSLTPFVTGWIGESDFAPWPVVIYGFVLLMCAVSYFILTRALLAAHGNDSRLARALGRDRKGKLSLVAYASAMAVSYPFPFLGVAIYFGVALVWLIPDRRIERVL